MRVAATLAALSLLALATPGAGADGGAKSRITITKLSATGAAGEISSGSARCEGGKRKVSLFVLEDFITDKLAITYTNAKGEWRVRRSLREGVYFAKVDASKGCRYDNSRRKRLSIG